MIKKIQQIVLDYTVILIFFGLISIVFYFEHQQLHAIAEIDVKTWMWGGAIIKLLAETCILFALFSSLILILLKINASRKLKK